MVFTTRLSGGKGGRNALETELRRLGITQKNSAPNHPTTCGKVQRFQQTMKKAPRPRPPADHHRRAPGPSRHLHRRVQPPAPAPIPAAARHPRGRLHHPPQSDPSDRSGDTHDRVRRDRVDVSGKITLRHNGRLHSIGIGRTHARTRVLVLAQDLHIRIIDAATGQLLRELTLDPTRRYQPISRPPGPTRTRQNP